MNEGEVLQRGISGVGRTLQGRGDVLVSVF